MPNISDKSPDLQLFNPCRNPLLGCCEDSPVLVGPQGPQVSQWETSRLRRDSAHVGSFSAQQVIRSVSQLQLTGLLTCSRTMAAPSGSTEASPGLAELLTSLSGPLQGHLNPCLSPLQKARFRATCHAALRLVDDDQDSLWQYLTDACVEPGLQGSAASSQCIQSFLKYQIDPSVQAGQPETTIKS